MGDKITRCTFYRHYLLYFKKEEESLPSPPPPLLNSQCCAAAQGICEENWENFGCAARGFYIVLFSLIYLISLKSQPFRGRLVGSQGSIRHLRNEKKLDRVNFRKEFWERKKWPIADRRVPSYDPTNNCGTHFGYTVSFFLLKWRIIKQ